MGTHLILLRRGAVAAEGPPLEVLGGIPAGEPMHLDGIRNSVMATIEGHAQEDGATRLRLADGPALIVPHLTGSPGTAVTVTVNSEDILLARGPVAGLSAQNLIPGTIERIAPHGAEAEVLVRTGGVTWIVSIVLPVVSQLGLATGVDVHMIIKARSCHVRPGA
jgi:molybdate transport system ATP-binding protein